MASRVQDLTKKGIAHPPSWLPPNIHYETMMGSVAYSVSSDTSDMDIYGFCIPSKEQIFPHLAGEIPGFGKQQNKFEQYQEHHLIEEGSGKSHDFAIFSIVKYFQLAMENNPNMIDSLFTPQFCVQHITRIGNIVRENRKLFLHKGSWPKFKGYAYSQLHKMSSKQPEGKRKEIREKFGFDVKFAYHVVRLLSEVEQILTEGDLDLQRNREQLKSIRRGEVSEEEIRQWASDKEVQLEKAYTESKLPWGPDEDKIKTLLINCLEEHYGNLEKAIVVSKDTEALREIQAILDKHKINYPTKKWWEKFKVW